MAISLVTSGSHHTYTEGSSFSITGIQSGDFILLIGGGDVSSVRPELSAPSGFTQGGLITDDAPDAIWAYRFADSTSLTVSGLIGDTGGGNLYDAVGYVYIVLRGVNTSNPINDSNTFSSSGTTNYNYINPPAVTTTEDNCWVIPIGILDDDNTASSVTPPSGYTSILNYDVPDNGSGNYGATIMTAYLEKSPAGSEDPGNFTFSLSDQYRTFTVAIEPAPVPTPTPTPTSTPTQTPTPSTSGLPPITIGAGMSLDEVRTYLTLALTASLQDCFGVAVNEYFNTTYSGSKDRLGNFQGYQVKAPTPTPTPSSTQTPTPTPTPSTPPAGITYVKSGYIVNNTSGDITLTITGIQSGDLVVLKVGSDNTDANTPTGFTLGDLYNSNANQHASWFYGFSSGTSWAFDVNGGTGNLGVVYTYTVWRGVNSSNPINTWARANNSSDQVPNPPSITTTVNNCVIIATGYVDDDDNAAAVGAPSGYTLAIAAQRIAPPSTNTLNGATVSQAYLVQTTAGSEDPGAWTYPADGWVAYTIALEPA